MKISKYIFGFHSIQEAILNGKSIDKILFQSNLKGENSYEILKLSRELDIPLQRVPLEALNRITRKNHQGVIAYLSPIEYQTMDEIVIRCFEEGRAPFILVLDGITDVRNMGATARTAKCAAVDLIIIPEKGEARKFNHFHTLAVSNDFYEYREAEFLFIRNSALLFSTHCLKIK